MKFIADGMLGKLARWLRLAGYDVTYIGNMEIPPEKQDDALLEQAKLEERELMTHDLSLHHRAEKAGMRSIFIRSSDVVSQLVEVSKQGRLKVEISPENSRCPMCNGWLKSTSKKEIDGLVPETVLEAQQEFWQCVKCGKTYWRGKHWKTIIEMASRYNRMVK